jgi:hypothetical protein
MYDFTVTVDDAPGMLAGIGTVLGDAGINIEGGFAVSGDGRAVVHVLIEGKAKARDLLREKGYQVDDGAEAVVVYVAGADRPGTLAKHAKRLAEAGVNIKLTYFATGSRLVFVTDDNAKARTALRG